MAQWLLTDIVCQEATYRFYAINEQCFFLHPHARGHTYDVEYHCMDATAVRNTAFGVKLFDPYFDVEIMISNKKMYQVSGVKRDILAHSYFGVTPATMA